MQGEVLVTGGAGYIGSHLVRQLHEAGLKPVVFDNLTTGANDAAAGAPLVHGDTMDLAALRDAFAAHRFEAVFHLAARLVVPESVALPLEYYANNTVGTLNVLRCCQEFAVPRLIFSSTAAVYGEPAVNPVPETAPATPMNPYGHSKRMSEQMIQDFAATGAMRYVTLRYFNVAGADPGGRSGQRLASATNLIKIACDAALGKRESVTVYGSDYDTKDGTGVRDYIHVEDLAAAHIDALSYLWWGGESATLNCGYGRGYSVREVLEATQRISGVPFKIVEAPRRPGDPACVIADARAIRSRLEWKPRFADLDTIISTSLAWEKKQLTSPPSTPRELTPDTVETLPALLFTAKNTH